MSGSEFLQLAGCILFTLFMDRIYRSFLKVTSLKPCFVCLAGGIHRLRVPERMTDPGSEPFSISEMPVIDPFCVLKAKPFISQLFQSVICHRLR